MLARDERLWFVLVSSRQDAEGVGLGFGLWYHHPVARNDLPATFMIRSKRSLFFFVEIGTEVK